ncbi:MAG: chromosomal replication initiator protein DnaA [Clostridiales bacterium]|nr:chromosomal replication initiator protein DnaA [Clostridiales bacterium]
MQFLETWERIANAVKLNSDISVASWGAFIKTLSLLSADENNIILEAPSTIVKATVENKYIDIIKEQAEFITNREYNIKININNENYKEPPSLKIISSNGVTSSYRFDNFIVGSSNQFAHAAGLAVAESPGTEYNPLFLYGGVGLGKTHLMNAIANYILERSPEAKIAYITCERFLNELIASIRNKKNEEFRQKYRNLDVLIIDDIQFIKGKESTQEEFFHTFNVLYNDHKQIIMASDRHPNEIETLTDRLRSRFQSGLISDIKPPDLETKIAILQKKAEEKGIYVSDDVLEYIAKTVNSNIRELEGAFNRVAAFKKLINKPIDLNTAKDALKDLNTGQSHTELSIKIIQETVCDTYGINIEDLTGKKRTKPLSTYRQIAEYLCRKYVKNITLSEIAVNFGGQNHTSVRTAVDKIQGILNEGKDRTTVKLVEDVEIRLLN